SRHTSSPALETSAIGSMTALKSSEVESFVARPDAARMVMLVYGEDAGLVRERVDALIAKFVDDPKDPFQLARLEGDPLAGEPVRWVEEGSAVPWLGGRRAVWVKAGTRNIARAVEPLLASRVIECRVVIEAGELRRNAPLRVLCERAKSAVTLPC